MLHINDILVIIKIINNKIKLIIYKIFFSNITIYKEIISINKFYIYIYTHTHTHTHTSDTQHTYILIRIIACRL